jgi:hypothetical protein
MNVDFEIGTLRTDDDWAALAEILGGPYFRVVQSIIRHLKAITTSSYLIESRYIDRDYSSDYRSFYAQTFKTYDRHCRRIHFFGEDVSSFAGNPTWSERVKALQGTSNKSYRGFVVVRPLPGAPIGRTVLLAQGPTSSGLDSVVTCRALVRANLLGAELDVTGASFMQQDSRVGACAQVAIWAGARHMHERHGYNWLSVADITKLASPNTPEESVSLPAGSDFLTSERMIRAINEMGFQPLCLEKPNIGSAILPYVESGVPVILGLEHGAGLGHAVTVVGRVFAASKKPTNNAIDYVPAFIVHDDQAGPYMLAPMNSTAAKSAGFDKTQLITIRGNAVDVDTHGVFAVVLMPIRAFSTAKEAERTAIGRINAVIKDITKIRTGLARQHVPTNERLLDELIDAHKKDKIVLRTYLSSTAGYRRHIALGTACDELKDVLLRLHLPHFTWVTEISTIDSYNHTSPGMRRMYGHSILDATSTGKDTAGLLMLHVPGLVFTFDVNAGPGQQQEFGVAIENDRLYECREKRFDH